MVESDYGPIAEVVSPRRQDGDFIAKAHPAAVLELVAEIRHWKSEALALHEAHKGLMAAERERCARIAANFPDSQGRIAQHGVFSAFLCDACNAIAAAIRSGFYVLPPS